MEDIVKPPPATIELTQYNPVRAQVAALKKANASMVFAYETPVGNKDARSHVYQLRRTKADVERTRKGAKADALEYGRRVDAVAKELTDDLDGMIAVHQRPLDVIEQREAAARAEAERLEAEAKAEAERLERDKQEAILAAERAEAARVRQELAAVQRQQEEDRIRREAAEKARADAEAKAAKERVDAAERERAAIEAGQRAERERQEAIIAAERAKVDAERQAVEAERRAIQAAKDAEARAEREKIEAAARAKAEQEAAVKWTIADEVRKQREAEAAAVREQIAREAAEAERVKSQEVRHEIVEDVAASICEVTRATSMDSARVIARAILDGEIPRVSVDTAWYQSDKAVLGWLQEPAREAVPA